MIDCLAVIGRRDQAIRIWEDTIDRGWVEKFIDQRKHTPLKSKFQMSIMAVVAGSVDLEELGIIAEAFQGDSRNSRYENRLGIAATLEGNATNRDVTLLHDAILG